jgi:hypothetical protein
MLATVRRGGSVEVGIDTLTEPAKYFGQTRFIAQVSKHKWPTAPHLRRVAFHHTKIRTHVGR